MLLVGLAADDDAIHPGKSYLAVSDDPVDTDKKENKIFLIYKEIQNGAVAKSYMTNSLL